MLAKSLGCCSNRRMRRSCNFTPLCCLNDVTDAVESLCQAGYQPTRPWPTANASAEAISAEPSQPPAKVQKAKEAAGVKWVKKELPAPDEPRPPWQRWLDQDRRNEKKDSIEKPEVYEQRKEYLLLLSQWHTEVTDRLRQTAQSCKSSDPMTLMASELQKLLLLQRDLPKKMGFLQDKYRHELSCYSCRPLG